MISENLSKFRTKIYHSFRVSLLYLLLPFFNESTRHPFIFRISTIIQRWFRFLIPPNHWFQYKIRTGKLNPPRIDEYIQWLKATEPNQLELNKQKLFSSSFSFKPLISLITPVFNPDPDLLRQAIESVVAQTYDNWQLCLVDGNSFDPDIRETIDEFVKNDSRVLSKFLDKNLGIAGNSNKALQIAQGDFVLLLDHDDILSPEALYQTVKRINEVPSSDILYFDEDKLTQDGIRKDPFFKPDWSPDLILSVNYLTHPVIRRSLVNEVGGFKPEMDGAQDWDLILRCCEQTANIQHIPRILYHWRQVHGSAAQRFSAKPWALIKQRSCIEAHLNRRGFQNTKVILSKQNRMRVLWSHKRSLVSVIIPSKDNKRYLQRCLNSILRQTDYSNVEILIIDNNSQDSSVQEYYKKIAKDKRIRIINFTEEFNYSSVNNLGANKAEGNLLLFLNNDIKALNSDWLNEMVRWAELPGVGSVGAKLLYPWNIIQHAGVIIGMEGHASHVFWGAHENYNGIFGSPNWYRNYSAVTGACLMIPRTVFEQVNGFDEKFSITFGDVDICLRIVESGYRIVYSPYARLIHYEGRTRGHHIPVNDIVVGYEKMKTAISEGDRYYNPNLSYRNRIPELVQPGEESRQDRIRRIVNEAAGIQR